MAAAGSGKLYCDKLSQKMVGAADCSEYGSKAVSQSVDRQIICTCFIQIIFILFCHIILLPSYSMHEVMQFILPILRIYCINNSRPFFTNAAQGAAFLYLAIELSVYFLLHWKRILVKLSILPAQFRKQGRCRMVQSPVSVIFYVIVSLYQTVR